MTSSPQMEESAPPSESLANGTHQWHRSHWAFIVIDVIRSIRGWIVPLGFVVVSQGFRGGWGNTIGPGLALVVIALSTVVSIVNWRNYRYRVTDRDVVLRHGLVNRQERIVPLERIQSVDISEQPLDRVFGVVRLQVQTGAGGAGGAEVEIKAIKRALADDLRRDILAYRRRRDQQSVSLEEERSNRPLTPRFSRRPSWKLEHWCAASRTASSCWPALPRDAWARSRQSWVRPFSSGVSLFLAPSGDGSRWNGSSTADSTSRS